MASTPKGGASPGLPRSRCNSRRIEQKPDPGKKQNKPPTFAKLGEFSGPKAKRHRAPRKEGAWGNPKKRKKKARASSRGLRWVYFHLIFFPLFFQGGGKGPKSQKKGKFVGFCGWARKTGAREFVSEKSGEGWKLGSAGEREKTAWLINQKFQKTTKSPHSFRTREIHGFLRGGKKFLKPPRPEKNLGPNPGLGHPLRASIFSNSI